MPFLAPIVGAISGAIASAGIIGQAIVGIGLNFVVGKLQQHMAKKNAKQSGGVQFELEYGENVSRKVACGLVGVAGHDCYVNTFGKANKYLQKVYVFSDFPCDGLSRIWAGGEELAIATKDGRNYTVTTSKYAKFLTFTFYDGTQSGADAKLIGSSNPAGRWTDSHLGTGLCYIVAHLTYDQEDMNAMPSFFFELRGARLYDPRKDSSIGGSGGHRWGNYATYEFSKNPVIMDYNYRRGFSINGDLFCGMAMEAVDLPIDRYAVAANMCDESTSYGARYECSVMFDADVDHGDNIEAVMTACGGIVIDGVEGSWPIIGSNQPIVETITDDDLIITEPARFRRRRSMAELVNAVSGTYPEPGNMWSPVGYDTQTNAAQVAIDRRTRDINLELPTVAKKAQANQLASIYYNENRFEATADIVVRPRFQTVKAGDWIRWNSTSYGNRVYMVQSRAIRALTSDGPRNVQLSLQERDGGIYAGVGVIPPTIPVPNGEPIYLNELEDFAPIPILTVGSDGRAYPAFRLSWSPIDDVTVSGVLVEWWLLDDSANKFSRQFPADVTIGFIQEGILSLTKYQFRHKLIANRSTNWTAPITVTSLDGGNNELEIGLARLQKEVLNRFQELQLENQNILPIIEQMMVDFTLQGAVGEVSRMKMRAELGQAFAQIIEERRVRAKDDEALAQIVTLLNAQLGEAAATLATEVTTRATADSALAEQITAAQASVGEVSANGLVKFALSASQAGVNARFSVMIRASLGAEYKESGFFLELYTVNNALRSRFAVNADQFVVTSGSASFLPMVFENGELKLQIANIGTVRTGLLQSQNGKMVINLTAGTISISD